MNDLQCPAKIIFARHGDAVRTAGGPRRLTDQGRQQSLQLAETLTHRLVAGLWASSLERAAETAAILGTALDLPVHPDDRLRELLADENEPPPPVTTDDAPEIYGHWLAGDLEGKILGESGHQVLARLTDIVEEISDQCRGETSVLVSHGGIVTLGLISQCRNVTVDLTEQHPLGNCRTAEIEVDSSGWTCTSWAGVALTPGC